MKWHGNPENRTLRNEPKNEDIFQPGLKNIWTSVRLLRAWVLQSRCIWACVSVRSALCNGKRLTLKNVFWPSARPFSVCSAEQDPNKPSSSSLSRKAKVLNEQFLSLIACFLCSDGLRITVRSMWCPAGKSLLSQEQCSTASLKYCITQICRHSTITACAIYLQQGVSNWALMWKRCPRF